MKQIKQKPENFLKLVVEHMDALVYIKDAEGRYLYANNKWCDYTSLESDELKGKTDYDIYPHDVAERFAAVDQSVLRSGELKEVRENITIKGGERVFNTVKFPLYGTEEGDKTPIGIAGISYDITSKACSEEDQRWQYALINSLNDAQRLYLAKGRLEAFTSLLETLVSLTDSTIGFIGESRYGEDGSPGFVTRAVSEVAWTEELKSAHEEHYRNGIFFNKIDSLYGELLRTRSVVISNDVDSDERSTGVPEGHPVLKTFMGIPVFHEKDLIGVVCVANREDGYTDLLAEKLNPFMEIVSLLLYRGKSESNARKYIDELARSEAQLAAIFENMSEGLILIDKKGHITSVNPAALKMFQWSKEELSGKTMEYIFSGETPSGGNVKLRIWDKQKQTEMFGIRKDGSRFPVEVKTNVFSYSGTQMMSVFVEDISLRKEYEENIKEITKKLEESNQILAAQAITDGLTGLYNRRKFDQSYGVEMSKAFRNKQAVSVILCDIDYFKKYNDRYGHLKGDEVLKTVASVLQDVFRRKTDLVFRYGGEEFAVILNGTSGERSREIAQTLIEQVSDLNVEHYASATGNLTVSVGGACSANYQDEVNLLEMADKALYQAKQEGRNRVVFYSAASE